MEENPVNAALAILNQGGATMYAIVLCSIILLTVVIERIWYFHRRSGRADSIYGKTADMMKGGGCGEALHYLKSQESSFARVFAAVLARRTQNKEQIHDALATVIAEELLGFERNLAHIGTLAVIAPFIGLLGTVLGIMRAFQDIALKGATGPAVVAKGVAEALVATAAGLFVAIPASIFFNYFKNRCRTVSSQMRTMGSRMAEMTVLTEKGEPLPEEGINSAAPDMTGKGE